MPLSPLFEKVLRPQVRSWKSQLLARNQGSCGLGKLLPVWSLCPSTSFVHVNVSSAIQTCKSSFLLPHQSGWPLLFGKTSLGRPFTPPSKHQTNLPPSQLRLGPPSGARGEQHIEHPGALGRRPAPEARRLREVGADVEDCLRPATCGANFQLGINMLRPRHVTLAAVC